MLFAGTVAQRRSLVKQAQRGGARPIFCRWRPIDSLDASIIIHCAFRAGGVPPAAHLQIIWGNIVLSEITRAAWERWKIIGEVFGDFQGRLFAVLFYFTLFVPFALGVRLLSDPLHLRARLSRWLDRAPVEYSLDDARKQF